MASRRLTGHHRLDAVRAHPLERAGDTEGALAAEQAAAARTLSVPEGRYPRTRAARLRERGEDGPDAQPSAVKDVEKNV